MKTAKSYFRYQLKSNLRPLIVISICVLILGFYLCADGMDNTYRQYYNDEAGRYVNVTKEYPNGTYYDNEIDKEIICRTPSRLIEYRDIVLSYPVIILTIMCYIVPVWMFSFMKKRRNLDCCYSLPISRRAFGMTNYLIGLVLVFVPFVLSYLQNILMYALTSFGFFKHLDFTALLTHFLLCLLMGFILYSLFVFVFNEANSILDGCIFIGTFTLVVFFLFVLLEDMIPSGYDMFVGISEDNAIPWAYFSVLLSDYEATVERSVDYYIVKTWSDFENVFWLIFWSVVGALSAVGFYFRFDKAKAEKTEDISDSVFGYRTLIPLLSIFGVIDMCHFGRPRVDGDPLSAIFITFAAIIGYTVYRRGVKYKKSDYAVIGILLFFTLVSAIS